MSEISPDKIKFIGNLKGQKKAEKVEEKQPYTEQINNLNLDKDPSSYLGRTQVKKINLDTLNFKGAMYDNIKKDLEVMNKNPELVTKSDKAFDSSLNAGNSYADSVAFQSAFVEEFSN